MKGYHKGKWEEQKWQAFGLTLGCAYERDRVSLLVEYPKDILALLSHLFKLVEEGRDQNEPIQSAFHTLVYAPTPETIQALKDFDPTQPSFFYRIYHLFQRHKPLQFHKVGLFFLSLVADRWFNTFDPIMTPDETRSLCMGWNSAVDDAWGIEDIRNLALAVLLDMINFPRWHPHIVTDKWKLLEHFASVPDDSQPLARCLKDTDLVDAISEFEVNNPDAIVLWSIVLRSKHEKLIPEVQEQLEVSAKSARRVDVDRCLSAIESELVKAKVEKGLSGYNGRSNDPRAVALKIVIVQRGIS